jgi:hypothetical protein
MVMVTGLEVELMEPDQLSNLYPLAGVAVRVTCVPLVYVPPEGERETEPEPEGLTETLRVYCVGAGIWLKLATTT